MKVVQHLGLGDAIICAPIIAKLATENDRIDIACWKHNLTSVLSFYMNLPNVYVWPFETENMMLLWAEDAELRLGYYNNELPQLSNEDFIEWFYRQAGVSLIDKDKCCSIKKAAASKDFDNNNAGYSKFVIVHDDKKRGFVIDKIGLRPYNDTDNSILTKIKTLSNASEIHCIDSSFLHLIEAIDTKGKLFYHPYARPNSTKYNCLKKNWTIVN